MRKVMMQLLDSSEEHKAGRRKDASISQLQLCMILETPSARYEIPGAPGPDLFA